MCTEDNAIIEAALECLCLIFSKADNRINIIIPPLMQNLLKMFMFPEVNSLLHVLNLYIMVFSSLKNSEKSY